MGGGGGELILPEILPLALAVRAGQRGCDQPAGTVQGSQSTSLASTRMGTYLQAQGDYSDSPPPPECLDLVAAYLDRRSTRP